MMLDGQIALITGAGSGIGRAAALMFARNGASVALLDIASAEETAAVVNESGGRAIAFPCDVSDEDQVATAVDAVIKTWQRIDCAFNNAGIEGSQGALLDSSLQECRQVLEVNFFGVVTCMRHEIRVMLMNGAGVIVNMASAAGLVPAPLMPAYSVSKAAVIHLSRSTALDYASQGIRVNALCPGPVKTSMQQRIRGVDVDISGADVPLGRIARADEIAGAAMWLCSDASSYMTGHALVIDGGCLLLGPRRSSNGAHTSEVLP